MRLQISKIGSGTSWWFKQNWSNSPTSECNPKKIPHLSSAFTCIFSQNKNSKLDLCPHKKNKEISELLNLIMRFSLLFSWNQNDAVCIYLPTPNIRRSGNWTVYVAKAFWNTKLTSYFAHVSCKTTSPDDSFRTIFIIITIFEKLLSCFHAVVNFQNNKLFWSKVSNFKLLCLQNGTTGQTFKATKHIAGSLLSSCFCRILVLFTRVLLMYLG